MDADGAEVLQALAEAVAALLKKPRRTAWTKAEAAFKLGCKESWLEEMARRRKIPFTKIGGALHFTDAHIAEIIALFEVRPTPAPRAALPEAPARTSGIPAPPPNSGNRRPLRPIPTRGSAGRPEAARRAEPAAPTPPAAVHLTPRQPRKRGGKPEAT
jgi:hypothetical protein